MLSRPVLFLFGFLCGCGVILREAFADTPLSGDLTAEMKELSPSSDLANECADGQACDCVSCRSSKENLLDESDWSDEDAYRFYGSKLLGTTIATFRTTASSPNTAPHTSSSTGSVGTAAYVGGVSFNRPYGAIRLECEGALREIYDAPPTPDSQQSIHVRAADNWSVLANAWRDVALTERLGMYAGGGVGGGGFRLTETAANGAVAYWQPSLFAWQAGGGATWQYNSLVTLDASYRFLAFGTATSMLMQPNGIPAGLVSSTMTANEILLMIRVNEPWRLAEHVWNARLWLPE